MASVEERVRLDDGAQTVLERWGDEGPVLLCVHGMTSSRKSWERLATHYAGRARIYSYDQRGHGDAANVSGPMTLHRALLDLYNVMDRIPEPVDTLIGHSWGGAVALLGGRRFDVKRVVGIDPMIRQTPGGWYDEFFAELKPLFAKKGDARERFVRAEFKEWRAADVDAKVHAVASMTIAPIERLRAENPPESWDLRRDLEAYPKPLLLLVADAADSVVSLEDLKFVREEAGPNAAIRVFEGQGHNLHRTDFDRFTAELDGFLERTALH